MGLKKWIEGFIKKMKWYDVSLIKLSTFFATLFLVTGWPAFAGFVMQFDWYWYLMLSILFAIPALKKMS
jgi:hypothetical protein